MTGPVSYVEIPADDYDRATDFYESVFGFDVRASPVGDYHYGVLSSGDDEIGAIVGANSIEYDDGVEVSYDPSATDGILVYFQITDPLEELLDIVRTTGGSLLVDGQPVGEDMELAIVLDSEGNRLGLLS